MRTKVAKQLSDDEQNIRRKARRRLIGAFALTLAVVVILPMVLESEPKPSGRDIDLRIPAADEAGAFAPKTVAPDTAVVVPSSSVPVASAKTEEVTVGKLPPADNQKEKPKVVEKTATAAESFVAQVGAYSNAETAKQELDKLKKWGFRAYTEKVSGVIRVRVGPYDNRDKAEKARQQLEKHGLHPVVMPAGGA